jgi:phosphatidate cytidylyltransferase
MTSVAGSTPEALYLRERKSLFLFEEEVTCLQGTGKQKRDVGSVNPRKKEGRVSSLTQRWLTALIAIPVVLVFVWFGGWWSFVATAIVVVVGCLEFYMMLLHTERRPLIWISLGLSLLFLVSAMLPQQRLLILEIGIGASILLSFPSFFWRKNLQGALVDWALTLVIAFYIGWPMSLLLLLRQFEPAVFLPASGGWVYLPQGMWWLMTTFLGVWLFDGAAFFTGRYLGRHKLAPLISPGKTWEGVIGGLVACVVTCLLTTIVPLGVPWYLSILLAVLIGAAATLGDLSESLIKRQSDVKDSGQIMPGHGGMLDRLDSLLFVVIVVYIFAQLIAK